MRLILATIFAIVANLIFSTNALATALPPNDLSKHDRVMLMSSSMTEEVYNQVIEEVVTFMKPYIEAHGAQFSVKSDWNDPTVNAYASQEGSNWYISMFGGLARRPEITPDGFAFVVCHEIGHHIGGFPFYTNHWAAAEGQADYFGTHTCLRELWLQDYEKNKEAADTVDTFAKIHCDAVWSNQKDRDLCYRITNSGRSFANLIYAFESEYGDAGPAPQFSTPDPSKVSQTDTYHPASQCRLDTVFQGALCGQGFDLRVIPGKDHPDGQESLAAEEFAAAFACVKARNFTIGMRPECWYKSRID